MRSRALAFSAADRGVLAPLAVAVVAPSPVAHNEPRACIRAGPSAPTFFCGRTISSTDAPAAAAATAKSAPAI